MIELLAPAGSMEALRAAVENGADAVYLGARAFNARRGAENFDREGLNEAVEYCHLRGVGVHVTLNTLAMEDELEALDQQIIEIAEAGADAVIVQDLGVAASVRKIAPDIALHASTQMAVHNRQGVEFLRDYGFKRVVLAREMPLSEIRKCADLQVELEAFCHGALCVSCSGQCLFSSLLGGRSGNRGMCAQPCRLPYRLGEKEGYLLSTRDLMLINDLASMREAGVVSVKIEGRMKRPEYVAVVTAAYRRALDGKPVAQRDRTALLQMFNRGGCSHGYLSDMQDGALMYSDQPNHRGVLVAEDGRLLQAVALDDALVVRQPGTEDVPVKVSGQVGARISQKGRIFRLVDSKQMASAQESYAKPKRLVALSAQFKLWIGEPMRLTVSDGTNKFTAVGESVQQAEKRPFDPERCMEQLRKTGGTAYRIDEIKLDADDMAFAAASHLNALRREALAGLTELRLKPYAKRVCPAKFSDVLLPEDSQPKLIAQSGDVAVLKEALAAGADELVFAPDDLRPDALEKAALALEGHRFALALPQVMNTEVLNTLNRFANANEKSISAVYISNAGQLSLDWPGELRGGYAMNLANNRAILEAGFARYTPSVELTVRQINQLSGQKELLAWGRIPLMQLRHCPLRAAWDIPGAHADCRRCDACTQTKAAQDSPQSLKGLSLVDRKGISFPLHRIASDEGCLVEVLNSVPMMLLRRWDRLPKASGYILLLSGDEPVTAIVEAYRHKMLDELTDLTPFEEMETTTGHFFRGVE